MAWAGAFLKALKDNDVRLVAYVPDNVLTPLLNGVTSDNYFRSVCTTREDEAIGVVSGAWLGGMKGVVMMQTSGFALIANALASRGVIALEGDGSILMSLGCLTTIGKVAPRNLTVIIWDNGIHQITGKQETATAGTTDIVAVAKGAGLANSHWVRDEAHSEQLLDRRFEDGGPLLLAATIDDQPGLIQTPRDPTLIRSRFMAGLGTGPRRCARRLMGHNFIGSDP